MLKIISDESSWYEDGLRFECTGCGKCCTGGPGFVWVNEEEIKEIADFLQIDIVEFSRLFLRHIDGKISLVESSKTYDCIFLKDKKCQIYSVRPAQCKTFPWWPKNLKSKEAWQQVAVHCEGICESAPLIPFETIQEQRALQESVNGP